MTLRLHAFSFNLFRGQTDELETVSSDRSNLKGFFVFFFFTFKPSWLFFNLWKLTKKDFEERNESKFVASLRRFFFFTFGAAFAQDDVTLWQREGGRNRCATTGVFVRGDWGANLGSSAVCALPLLQNGFRSALFWNFFHSCLLSPFWIFFFCVRLFRYNRSLIISSLRNVEGGLTRWRSRKPLAPWDSKRWGGKSSSWDGSRSLKIWCTILGLSSSGI